MTSYNIDIVSDTVCPWCFLGKRRLDAAIEQHQRQYPSDTFTITWHAYYLNPDAPKSVDKQAYYQQKFGVERTRVMQGHMKRLGEQYGINFAFGGRTGNTRDSHRLVQLGKSKGEDMQTKVVVSLFNAYFESEEDITSKDILIARGVKAGLAENEVREWMDSDKGGAEVDQEVKKAQTQFITGVPNFTINGRYQIQGAEEPSSFLEVFNAIKAKQEDAQTKISSTQAC
ncbi:hypothetical protein MRB53_037851 [Persea americana]|nr:hypothetical protein MRB53_037851 [Persea americana]